MFVQCRVAAHTGVCRKLHQLLPNSISIVLRLETRAAHLSADVLRRFLGRSLAGAQKRGHLPRRKRGPMMRYSREEGHAPEEASRQVELVVRDAHVLQVLVKAVRSSLERTVQLDLAKLVKVTLPHETLHHMIELIEACGSRLVSLNLASNELRPHHIGLLSARLSTCSNMTSLCVAHNRLDIVGLSRLACAGSICLTKLTHLDLSATLPSEAPTCSGLMLHALGDWIRANTNLTSLHLQRSTPSPSTKSGVSAMQDASASSTSAGVALHGDGVGFMHDGQGGVPQGSLSKQAAPESYLHALQSLPNLTSLKLAGHMLGPAAAAALSSAFAPLSASRTNLDTATPGNADAGSSSRVPQDLPRTPPCAAACETLLDLGNRT